MRIVCLSAALLVSVLGGCASQDGLVAGGTAPVVVANTTTDLNAQTKLHCHKEAAAGSNMIHNVCETEKTEAERQAMQNQISNNMGNVAAHQGVGH
jgi:hypothetical protein